MAALLNATSDATCLSRLDLERAAEALGGCVALGYLAELGELQSGWLVNDRRAWWKFLDTPEAVAWQRRGYAWAPDGRMWRAAAGFRARPDAAARDQRRSTDPRGASIACAAFAASPPGSDARAPYGEADESERGGWA
jgi:hypothetical protein